ncbi:MAG: hypothetical protein D6727_10625 [Gammaproteobacteria bacterium]|nr:MAG: hypothetical protein D6727_10625 [Gammaproteobacteria bacterium]
MSTAQISRQALDEIDDALNRYRELCATRVADGHLAPNTEKTYMLHATNFVRWLHGEFDPGTRSRP